MFMMPGEGGPPELYAHLVRARASVLGYVTRVIGDQVDGGGGDTELSARSPARDCR